jgi:hypothetical protein
MAKWTIKQTVEYWAEGIEADTEEEAMEIYLQDQDSYYYATQSEKITMEETEKPCVECGVMVDADIHAEELGFCIPCQHEYFSHEDEEESVKA